MSDEPEDPDNVTYLDVTKPPERPRRRRAGAEGGAGALEKRRERIPVLPEMDLDASDLQALGPLTQRDIACVNLRLMGVPFVDIARTLEFSSAAEARRCYTRALASTHPPEDWDTLRQAEVMRAEMLLRRSFAMASADFLVDTETGERIPNVDRLRWHDQAGKDLALHAMISGAKAPTRVEVTPTEQQYQAIVDQMLAAEGYHPPLEANIVDVEEVPDGPAAEAQEA